VNKLENDSQYKLKVLFFMLLVSQKKVIMRGVIIICLITCCAYIHLSFFFSMALFPRAYYISFYWLWLNNNMLNSLYLVLMENQKCWCKHVFSLSFFFFFVLFLFIRRNTLTVVGCEAFLISRMFIIVFRWS